jgi:hypothetical protein
MLAGEEMPMRYVTEFSLCAAAFIASFAFGEALLKRPQAVAVRIARSLAERLRRP